MAFRSLQPRSGRGRQAEARRNDLVVLEAARDVFAAQGADAPISAVAARAGVGVGTLYRRYGSKTELLQRLCVLAMEQALAAADDALAAGDPWDGLCGYITACVELRSGALASLAGQIETTAEMRGTARRSMARLDEIVARAQAAGQPAGRRHRAGHQLADRAVQPPAARPARGRPRSATCGPGWSPSRWTGSAPVPAWPRAAPGSPARPPAGRRRLREPLVARVLGPWPEAGRARWPMPGAARRPSVPCRPNEEGDSHAGWSKPPGSAARGCCSRARYRIRQPGPGPGRGAHVGRGRAVRRHRHPGRARH